MTESNTEDPALETPSAVEAEEKPKAPRKAARKSRAPKKAAAESAREEQDEIPLSFSTSDDDLKSDRVEPERGSEDFDDSGSDEGRAGFDARDDRDRREGGDEGREGRGDAPEQERPKFRQQHGQGGQQRGGGKPPHKQGGNFNKQKGNFQNQPKKQKGKQKGKQPQNQNQKQRKGAQPKRDVSWQTQVDIPEYLEAEWITSADELEARAIELRESEESLNYNDLLGLALLDLADRAREMGVNLEYAPSRLPLMQNVLLKATEERKTVFVEGIVETTEEGFGFLVYAKDNYRVKPLSAFIPPILMKRLGLRRGLPLEAQIEAGPRRENNPLVLKVESILGKDPEENLKVTPFEDLIPYYPTERMLLEVTDAKPKWDNLSMRVVDLLTPIGFGQRGLIVAPPRTGKTILMQGIANAVRHNHPKAHLIILLVDERPEEVTDFRRQGDWEVVASTFDEPPESHVHAAEMVSEKARCMVQAGEDVVILLDSITRLARAYNALMPNSGKILSGGVEANALQKPKRFFGSARNIEGGGSLTILGTALVETGSRMDEVIFEEFKGTGNMEIHLDRALVDKRIFPAFALERSGTRKEELLYHKDEIDKIYSLRRAMKGVPTVEAVEMLIQRMKKTRTNIEFLMSVNR